MESAQMNQSENQVNVDNDQLSNKGPGQFLGELRESMSIDKGRMAAMLHLKESMIDALERDDYASLSAPVFVRGYLMNYARMLDIAVEPIMDAYARINGTPVMPTINAVSTRIGKTKKIDLQLQIIIAALVVVVVLISVIWWAVNTKEEQPIVAIVAGPADIGAVDQTLAQDPVRSNEDVADQLAEIPGIDGVKNVQFGDVGSVSEGNNKADSQRSTEMLVTAGTSDLDGADGVRADLELPKIDDRAQPDMDLAVKAVVEVRETDQSLPPVAKLNSIEPATTTAVTDRDLATPSASLMSNARTADADQPSVDARSEVAPAVAVNQPSGASTLVLIVSEDSWVRVQDGNDKRLVNAVLRAGTKRVVVGELPFHLVLGNSHGVAITFNDQSYDYSAHVTGNVARFTLE